MAGSRWPSPRRAPASSTRRDEAATPSDVVERQFTPPPPTGCMSDVTQHMTGEGWLLLRGRDRLLLPPGGRLVDRGHPLSLSSTRSRWPSGTDPERSITATTARPTGAAGVNAEAARPMGSIGDVSITPSRRASSPPCRPSYSTGPAGPRSRPRSSRSSKGFYNPRRRHSTLGYHSPADYETQHRAGQQTQPQHDQHHPTPTVREAGATSTQPPPPAARTSLDRAMRTSAA